MMRSTPMKASTKPMKRGGFKPRTAPMNPGKGFASSGFVKPRKPMRTRKKSIPAVEEAWYRRVAALPCAHCGLEGHSQAAHSNRHQDGKGMGIKAHYKATFPLCATRPGEIGCHVRHDQCIGMTREEADARTEFYITDTLAKLGEVA